MDGKFGGNLKIFAMGISLKVVHGFNQPRVLALVGQVKNVVTAENHVITGGLASAVADAVTDAGLAIRLRRVGIPDCFCESGSIP